MTNSDWQQYFDLQKAIEQYMNGTGSVDDIYGTSGQNRWRVTKYIEFLNGNIPDYKNISEMLDKMYTQYKSNTVNHIRTVARAITKNLLQQQQNPSGIIAEYYAQIEKVLEIPRFRDDDEEEETNELTIYIDSDQQTNNDSAIIQQDHDLTWLNYFRPVDAYKDFTADVLNMPSSKTPEKHTWKVYSGGLQYWFDCFGDAMPTKSLVNRYITHLRHEKEWRGNKGLSVSTIGSKYLAPLRKYIDFLQSQHIESRVDGSPLNNQDRNYIMDARQQLQQAIRVKTPKNENTSNLSPLYQHGERLTVGQIQQLYDACDVNKLAGLRDFAILYTGFTTGMRIAELRRMTLNKIKKADACYLIHVRRKRGNRDPISLDARVYNIIIKYVERYNAALPSGDPRRISGDTPLWQSIQHNDTPFPYMYQGNDMHATGMSASAIRYVLKKRAKLANQGSLSEFPQFAPHDMRRTVAAIAHTNGMGIPEIQSLLGHKNGGVTLNYIGKPPQPEKSLITNLPGINWNIPDIPDTPHQQEFHTAV